MVALAWFHHDALEAQSVHRSSTPPVDVKWYVESIRTIFFRFTTCCNSICCPASRAYCRSSCVNPYAWSTLAYQWGAAQKKKRWADFSTCNASAHEMAVDPSVIAAPCAKETAGLVHDMVCVCVFVYLVCISFQCIFDEWRVFHCRRRFWCRKCLGSQLRIKLWWFKHG